MRAPTSTPRTRPAGLVLLLALAPAAAGITRAQETADPLVTDRPDFTESPVSVQPGRVQLETGYTYEEAGDVTSQSFGEILVRIGLSNAVEARLGANSYQRQTSPQSSTSGLENSFVGVKVETSGGGDEPALLRPATALLLGTTLPTGGSEVREPHLEPGVVLALDWALRDPLGLAANVGLAYASEDGEQYVLGTISSSLGIELARDWGGFIEYFAFLPEGDRDTRHFFDAGLTFLVARDFQLDLRLGTEASGETDYFAGLGLAYRF